MLYTVCMAGRMTTMNLSLPKAMRSFIKDRVSKGDFGTVSGYIRHLVREDERAEARRRLEDLLREGLEGPAVVMDDKEWASIRAEFKAKAQRRQSA